MGKILYLTLFILYSLFSPHTTFAIQKTPPILSIASPKDGETILGNTVTFSFVIGNFKYVDFEQKNTPGSNEGHLHLFLDEPNPNDNNTNEIISHDEHIFENVPPGNHTIIAEVVKNDHSPYKPEIKQIINFTTQLPSSPPPTPTPSFLSTLAKKVSKEVIFAICGALFLIIGFIIYLFFGRKKFM